MQDEARHVGYGTLHLKRFLQEHPEREPEIHHILDQGEEATLQLFLKVRDVVASLTSRPRSSQVVKLATTSLY
jgi:hypothetical protein